ncbi:hypothetical protein BH20ACT5_BH20ACT5_12650 [soil metagenome]
MPTPGTSGGVLILVNSILLFGPGAILGLAAGLRWWAALAVAPLATYGLVAILAPGVAGLGWAWGPGWLAGSTVLAAAVLLALRLGVRRISEPPATSAEAEPASRGRPGWLGELAVAGGVITGGLIGALTAVRAMGGLDRVNQHWDAIFHANAIRFIRDTGDADPAALRAINNYELAEFFYPNTYHILAGTVGQLTDTGVFALLNSQFLFLAGVTGLGLAVLVRQYGGGIGLAASVPIVLASFSAFPNDLLDWGPLLPYGTGLALIPAFLVLLTEALRRGNPAVLLLLAGGAVGLMGIHPGAAFTAAVFALALVAFRWRGQPVRIRADVVVLSIVAVFALGLGYRYMLGAFTSRLSAVGDWPVIGTPGQMVGQLLTLNHGKPYPQYTLVVLMALAVFRLRKLRELYWLLSVGVIFCVLFVQAASYEGALVGLTTGPWWNDRWRLAAVVGIVMAVLAAHGVVTAAELLLAAARRILRRGELPRPSFAAAILVVLAGFGLITQGFYVSDNAERMSVAYREGRSVSAAENAGMQVLAELVRPGERVMNDPFDGSALMYALYDIDPIFGHVISPGTVPELGPDQRTLITSFHCLDTDTAVQELVRDYNIRYVFLGNDFVVRAFSRAEGLRALGLVRALTLVHFEDGVSIYRVDTQALAAAPTDSGPCGSTG